MNKTSLQEPAAQVSSDLQEKVRGRERCLTSRSRSSTYTSVHRHRKKNTSLGEISLKEISLTPVLMY